MGYNRYETISDLVGKIFTSVVNTGDAIVFKNEEETYSLHHEQYCCESVDIDDVVGDLSDLEDHPILVAEESFEYGNPKSVDYGNGHTYEDESSTWSFYKFGTVKGWVDVKFYGSSNGYYSEQATLYKVN